MIEQACARLRGAQMRVTQPRVAILQALISRSGPASIEQLHQLLDQKACDLVTVYRCLAAFEQIGLVRRSYLHNGTSLYEFSLGQERHYHIVCKDCGASDRIDYFSVEGPERMLEQRGYREISHLVEFFGVCPTCQQKARSVVPAAIKSRG
ncbi:MAG TPA: Fur family transcriptional regulator [Opitutaceae bacterium]|nr:Fur family transcriptional regulator [Opitutaceae bacterium]